MAMASRDTDRALMPPPPPPKRNLAHLYIKPGEEVPKQVLNEDDYVAQIEAIVERDYFPDIPKLRSQLEWEKAVSSGDPYLIRQAQINIARRRAGLKTPAPGTSLGSGRPHTGGTWGATPGMTQSMLRTPAMTPLPNAGAATPGLPGAATPGPGGAAVGRPDGGAAADHPELRAPPMSLDAYVSQYTSEDNASFARLQAKNLAQKRQKVAHHLEDKNKLLLEGPGSNPTEEYGTSGQQPFTLKMTKHNPTSALYYSPNQRPLSITEAAEFAKRPPRSINIKGTRLKAPEVEAAQQQQLQGTNQPGQAKPVGLAAPVNAGTPRDFSARLPTPALTPSALGGESPFMTWGDIEGTPLRLEPEEGVAYDPKALDGPMFAVQGMPKRDQVAHELAAAKSVKELRKRQKAAKLAAIAGAPPGGSPAVAAGHHLSTPRPGSQSAGVAKARSTPAFSPAAQRLVHAIQSTPKSGSAKGVSLRPLGGSKHTELPSFGEPTSKGSVDASLRASYRPSPALHHRSTPTPSLHRHQTPTPSRGPLGGSALVAAKAAAPSSSAAAAGKQAPPGASAAKERGVQQTPGQGGGLTDNLLNM